MNMQEHHLIVLMEECAETSIEIALARVAQRASKQLRFGSEEVQPGQEKTNRQRLRDEILDLICCIHFLEKSGQIDEISVEDIEAHMTMKQEKIDRMLALSRELGRLESNTPTTES